MSTGSAGRTPRLLLFAAAVLGVASLTLGWLLWTARAEVAAQSLRVVAMGSPECGTGGAVNDGRRIRMVPTTGRTCIVDIEAAIT